VQYLTKGKPIQVIGDFEDNTYQDKNNVCQIGRTVIANSIDFINDGENKPANNGQTTSQTQSQTQVQTAAPTQQTTTELPKFNTTQQAVAQNVAVNAANPSVVDEPVDDLPF
jgi:single-stranded DNA-binding protein